MEATQENRTGAWLDEREHLEQTLAVVKSERQKTEAELGVTDGNDRLINVSDDGSDDAKVAQFVMQNKLRTLRHLRLSERQPYFARLDFTPDNGAPALGGLRAGKRSSVYVGRWGVMQTPEYRVCVADWRSPVANLYYSGQLGRVSYDAPDGEVRGELSLKRMLGVEQGALVSVQDTGVIGQEKFLTDALSQATSSRLREVVSTIQAEQNVVIRYDPFKPLCVQGVAGSGKTTIALHRMAWILYRLQKTLAPKQLLILAPNPLFLSYISAVLPDLGVDDVRQTTFEGLCRALLGGDMPKLREGRSLSDRLQMDKPARDLLDERLRRKGALSLYGELKRFLQSWEQTCFPQSDITLGRNVVLTAEEIRRFFLTEFRHFPLKARMGEVRKVASVRLRQLSERAAEKIGKAADDRLDSLLRELPDGEERRAAARALLDSRDERLLELKQRAKQFLREFDTLWQPMGLTAVYEAFWRDMAERDAAYLPVLESGLPLWRKKQAARDDLPALLILANGLYGLKRLDIRHVVIDEAQDVPPLQVKALRELIGRDAFTLVGDLCQGVYGDEGVRSWNDLGQGIFAEAPTVTHLGTAYRSTVEITQTGLSVMARHPVKGAGEAKPVLRHGEKPRLLIAKDGAERTRMIAQTVRAWLDEGFQGVAVTVKTPQAAKKLHAALQKELPQARLTGTGDADFAGGVQVLDASVVKGLEFDCVLIADADEQTYPDERFYAKLFYVLCTRALHRLTFLCEGAPARHLENAEVERGDGGEDDGGR